MKNYLSQTFFQQENNTIMDALRETLYGNFVWETSQYTWRVYYSTTSYVRKLQKTQKYILNMMKSDMF